MTAKHKSRLMGLIFSMVMLFFLFNGGVDKRVLERMGLIVAAGYDELPNDRILGTMVLYQIDPDAKEKVNVVANTAFTSKGIRSAENVESAKKLVSGQVRVTVYQEKLAKKGIINLVDTLSRDADIGTGVYLTVSKNRTFELLSHRYPEFANIGTFLYQDIKQNIRGELLPSPTLHEFLHDYFSPGKDPVLPYITKQGNEVLINRIAMFKDDRMVDTMTLKDAFFLKLLRDRFRSGNLELTIDQKPLSKFLRKDNMKQEEKIHLVIEQISSECKIAVKDEKTPAFDIQIDLESRLQEISSQIDVSKPESLKTIQTEINKRLEEHLQKFLKDTQKMNVDPVGFGQKYMSQVRHADLTSDKWRELYRKAKFSTKVNTLILRTGVTR